MTRKLKRIPKTRTKSRPKTTSRTRKHIVKKGNPLKRKSIVLKRTRLTKKGGTAYWQDPTWADEENYNQDGNQNGNQDRNQNENRGYRNHVNAWHQNRNTRNQNRNQNRNMNGYNADEDTDEEDIEQNYEDYQNYIEELTDGLEIGCTTTTLEDKLYFVDREIEKVAENYDTLVQGIANQTLGKFLETYSLESSYSSNLSEWHRNAVGRAGQFQRISVADLNHAFLYLLPSFDAEKKYLVLSENDEDSPMHEMIRKYAYKMITALFTRSNITYAVLKYDETPSSHQFMENLLGVMRSASQITNQYMREDWNTFLEIPMDRSMFVHSGGNMTVMIAGMLCYLYDTWNSGYYQPNSYGDTLLEEIRQEFETELVRGLGNVDGFYIRLTNRIQGDMNFQRSIKVNTEKISDLDLLFMGPDYIVNDINNPYLFQINELTAYTLRRIMVSAHRDDDEPETAMAYHVMPFAGDFDQNWSKFMFSNMSEITQDTVAGMRDLHEYEDEHKKPYYGYRQTSNLVEDVPMYLNRMKQGYQPFFNLDLSNIPNKLQIDYSKKYGECLDCSIGATTNPLYAHKQANYISGNYYTLDTLIYEFNFILAGIQDDKYQKRLERRDFLHIINNAPVNVLFQIMGRHIS